MGLFDRFKRRPEESRSPDLPQNSSGQDGPGTGAEAAAVGYLPETEAVQTVITKEVLRKATHTLEQYKAGKGNLERRVIENEEWWKLRHWDYIKEKGTTPLKTRSAWLVNVILSKHADSLDAYPEPTLLPRESSDAAEAQILSSIVPVILQNTEFERVWSDAWWKKLKAGGAVYGVFWDGSQLNGLGDISIREVAPLNLFWEPGVTDIQDSRNLFYVELADNETLVEKYPQLEGKLNGGKALSLNKYRYDDNVNTENKSVVVDWYYKRQGKLHYVKYCGETVLFATEDDPELARRGLYDHGKYPFVMDPLFPEEGTPFGYGYIDICKDAQRQIDLMNTAIVANCLAAATPRWLKRGDDGINEEEYADWTRPFVHVQGSIDDSAIKPIPVQQLTGNYLSILVSKIDEMKETSGNRDVNNGGAPSGVTAASAIAAMQEQSGKLSRDQIQASYRVFRLVVNLVIELIRQFYDAPRQFRILGQDGLPLFVSFSNSQAAIMRPDGNMQAVGNGLLPQSQGGMEFGQDMGMRLPVFDIEVQSSKQTSYSKLSYNELALQFYQLGFFNPAMADQSMAALQMMDFKGKEQVRQQLVQLRMDYLRQQMAMLQMGAMPGGEPTPKKDVSAKQGETGALGEERKQNAYVEKARAKANASTQPG